MEDRWLTRSICTIVGVRNSSSMNMVWELKEPDTSFFSAEEVYKDNDDSIVCWERTDDKEPVISNLLTQQHAEKLNTMLSDFEDVLCSKAGNARVAEHVIKTDSVQPIHSPLYHLPYTW